MYIREKVIFYKKEYPYEPQSFIYSQKGKRGEQEEGWRRMQGGEDGQPGLLDTLYFTFHAISKP